MSNLSLNPKCSLTNSELFAGLCQPLLLSDRHRFVFVIAREWRILFCSDWRVYSCVARYRPRDLMSNLRVWRVTVIEAKLLPALVSYPALFLLKHIFYRLLLFPVGWLPPASALEQRQSQSRLRRNRRRHLRLTRTSHPEMMTACASEILRNSIPCLPNLCGEGHSRHRLLSPLLGTPSSYHPTKTL